MQMIRDPKQIAQHLTNREGAFFTDQPLAIEFPAWYMTKGLYRNENIHYLYGVFAIVMGKHYAVSLIPTVVSTSPISVKEIEREDGTYIQLLYAAGSKVLQSNKAIMQPFMAYDFFDGFFLQAKVPWYIDYEDLCTLMDNTVSYGGTNLGINQTSNELLSSFIARDPQDKRKFFRTSPKGKPAFVDLMDVRYSSLSTVNKLAGNYFNESLVSALVHKEKSPTTLEKHVRN
jgi:hypothetical protein